MKKNVYGARWRWWVARQLDRLPGQCWAEHVFWVVPISKRPRSPWSPVRSACTATFPGIDRGPEWRCYCGKVGADGKPWRGETP